MLINRLKASVEMGIETEPSKAFPLNNSSAVLSRSTKDNSKIEKRRRQHHDVAVNRSFSLKATERFFGFSGSSGSRNKKSTMHRGEGESMSDTMKNKERSFSSYKM